MLNKPSNQHYVPKNYLKEFTNFQKTFFSYTRGGNKDVPVTPSKVCYSRNYFDIQTEEMKVAYGGLEDAFIEKEAFKFQENNYNKLIKPLLTFSNNPVSVTYSSLKIILETLATIKRRNPSFKEGLTQRMTQLGERDFKEKLEQSFIDNVGFSREKVKEDSFQEMINKRWENFISNPERINDLYLSGFLGNKTIAQEISETLLASQLYVLNAPIGTQFITSDNPGFTIAGEHVLNFGGLGGTYEFYFPISSRSCILIDSTIPDFQSFYKQVHHKLISEYEVRRINYYSSNVSMKRIFSNSKYELQVIRDMGYI